MGRLCWFCLSVSLLALWVAPRGSSCEDISAWLPASNEDAVSDGEALTSRSQGLFRQALAKILGTQREDDPRQTGLEPNSFSPREYVKEAPFGSFPQNTLLRRLWESGRKQKKRGTLSECFWKYCV